MKNYNINFSYILVPMLIATGYVGANYLYSNNESEKCESINEINKITEKIINQVKLILNENNIYNSLILKNRKLFCKSDIFINIENIYIETLKLDERLKYLFNLFIENVESINWFKNQDELNKIFFELKNSEDLNIKAVLEKLNYDFNKIPNNYHKNNLLNLIDLSIKSLEDYFKIINKSFEDINQLINSKFINDKKLLNDLNFIDKDVKKSFIKFQIQIINKINKLVEFINLIEWINIDLLEKSSN